jgi:hypothetical protein
MQIFVNLLGGRTRTLCFGDEVIPVSLLKKHIEDFEGIPCHEQRLACSQRELVDDTLLSGDDMLFVSLSLRVVGGKGGFGSLLRGAPSKIGQKKTDNFDACRDLSGKRLRHANNEKKLQEWIANAKEREMERLALKHIKKMAKKHKFDDEKYTNESNSFKESISGALEKGIDEAKKSSVLLNSKKRALEQEPTTGPFKKRQVWGGLDDIADEESEPEVKEKKPKKNGTTTRPLPTTATTTTTTTTTTTSTSTTSATAISTTTTAHEESTTTSTSTSSVSVLPPPITTTTTETTETAPLALITSTPEPLVEPVVEPVDLSKFATAKELEAIGGEALKAELQRLGLLCGGTPADRANRLFLLKTTPIEKLDKKHFAKKNNKK